MCKQLMSAARQPDSVSKHWFLPKQQYKAQPLLTTGTWLIVHLSVKLTTRIADVANTIDSVVGVIVISSVAFLFQTRLWNG